MPDLETETARILREIQIAQQAFALRVGALNSKIDDNFAEVKERFNSLQAANNGESVLGRYAVAQVEKRLSAIEHRLSMLESGR